MTEQKTHCKICNYKFQWGEDALKHFFIDIDHQIILSELSGYRKMALELWDASNLTCNEDGIDKSKEWEDQSKFGIPVDDFIKIMQHVMLKRNKK